MKAHWGHHDSFELDHFFSNQFRGARYAMDIFCCDVAHYCTDVPTVCTNVQEFR